MTLIEGVGDEVTHFFIFVFFIIIGCLAWWTTSISENRQMRTVLLLERRRTHARLTSHTGFVNIADSHTEFPNIIEENLAHSDPVYSDDPEAGTSAVLPSEGSVTPDRPDNSSNREDLTTDDEEDERDYILETMDAAPSCVAADPNCLCNDFGYADPAADDEEDDDNSVSRNTSSNGESGEQNDHDVYDDAQNVSIEEAPSNASSKQQSVKTKEEGNTDGNNDNIRIKLKYINDDLKLVDGSLQEQLGDFKRRHFQGELSSNKLIRLIFNGQVLQPDTLTLRNCGLFDNCVVHCLVHQKRQLPSEENRTESVGGYYTNFNRRQPNNQQGRDWDLGNIMVVFISLLLASAWYLRFVYAHYYSLSATVGLTFLTGVFTVTFTAMYFPVTDFRQRTNTE